MSNKLILAGIATEILLITLIVYTPWGNALFGAAHIALVVWLFIIPFALGMLALEELREIAGLCAPATAAQCSESPDAWAMRGSLRLTA